MCIRDSLKTADPACVPLVRLLIKLLACENSLICVEDDYMVAAVSVWCVSWLVPVSYTHLAV